MSFRKLSIALLATIAILAGRPVSAQVISASYPTARGAVRTVAMQWLNRSGDRHATSFGIHCPADLGQAPADCPLVILVHGFNSAPERNDSLLVPIRAAAFPCATFRYPNDQPIAESAALLSKELRRLAGTHPDRRIALLSYSMGGLVAREAVENPDLDPGNVSTLLMIAPPTGGTSCALCPLSGDLWEFSVCTSEAKLLDRIYASLEDGLGEARYDLMPGSPFLERLNGRGRNPRVRYSMFLGTGGYLTQSQLEAARRLVDRLAGDYRAVTFARPVLEDWLCDLDDAGQPGDGVVSLVRGRLDGVDDTVLLDFNHWSVIDCPDNQCVTALHGEIVKRLQAQRLARPAPIP